MFIILLHSNFFYKKTNDVDVFFYVKIISFLKGGVSDKGYNSMSREELKSLTHQPSSGETDSEQQKANKEKTSLRFTLPSAHKGKEKKEVNGEQTALHIVQQV